jgi:myo-inositol-hexaphosphate 3-phosphohydrolase
MKSSVSNNSLSQHVLSVDSDKPFTSTTDKNSIPVMAKDDDGHDDNMQMNVTPVC